MNRTFLIVVAILVFPLAGAGIANAAEKPNIIVIMADDLGYGDVSCNGATSLPGRLALWTGRARPC